MAVARDAWIEKDSPLALWLVPTNTIRRQTVEALTNTRHPYRQALDEAFRGRVRVFDVADFTHIRPQVLRDHCCIVVGTIQTLRVTHTEGRKVYAHHEETEPHFEQASATAPGLERREGGRIKFSFANLLHLHRPLMIVDEAHNAVTGLTREMQMRVNPCAVIEFTATPKPDSNILHSVTAQELKREEMIKLPIVLAEHESWQNAVNGAIAARARLAGATAVAPSHRGQVLEHADGNQGARANSAMVLSLGGAGWGGERPRQAGRFRSTGGGGLRPCVALVGTNGHAASRAYRSRRECQPLAPSLAAGLRRTK